jgi:hypothetical protein
MQVLKIILESFPWNYSLNLIKKLQKKIQGKKSNPEGR